MFGDKPDNPRITRRINRIRIAERFGWTLDYIDSLSAFDQADIAGVMDGDKRAEEERARRKS